MWRFFPVLDTKFGPAFPIDRLARESRGGNAMVRHRNSRGNKPTSNWTHARLRSHLYQLNSFHSSEDTSKASHRLQQTNTNAQTETLSAGRERSFDRLFASFAQCLDESRVIDTPGASASDVVAYVFGRQTGSKTSEGKHSIALVASLTCERIGEHAQKHFFEAPCSLLADGLPSACINHVFFAVRSRTIP
jgi:hypothetical protein